MDRLFDEFQRTMMRPANHGEGGFWFYNTSAWAASACIREVLEGWYAAYPVAHRPAFVNRFRHPVKHQSAFFELFLHELFLRTCGGVRVEPDCSWTSRHPDFEIAPGRDADAYVEAVVATGHDRDENLHRALLGKVLDALNTVDTPDFVFMVHATGSLTTLPPVEDFRRKTEAWVRSLDYESCCRMCAINAQHELPELSLASDRWELGVSAWPKPSAWRGRPGIRPVGGYSEGVGMDNVSAAIRKTLDRKADDYPLVPTPFFLAVNVVREFVDDDDVLNALLGDDGVHYETDGRGRILSSVSMRQGNGFFAPDRHQEVSGVLVARTCYANSIPRADLRVYHNPWCFRPAALPGVSSCTTTIRGSDGLITRAFVDGQPLDQVFGLARDWPGRGNC